MNVNGEEYVPISDLAATLDQVDRCRAENEQLRLSIKAAHDHGFTKLMDRGLTVDQERAWANFLSGVGDVYKRAFGEEMSPEADALWDLPVKVRP